MKKLLFIIPGFKHGGTNKSLSNMLSVIEGYEYDIDICSMSDSGPYKEIFSQYNLLNTPILLAISQTRKEITKESLLNILWKIPFKIINKLLNIFIKNNGYIFFYLLSARLLQKNNYDTIIAFQEGRATTLASFIKAKNKLAWVRCDYSYYRKKVNKNEICMYNKFNYIICVSKYTRSVFLEYYPSLSDRCLALYNVLNAGEILEQSKKVNKIDTLFENDCFTAVSVGRLVYAKQYEIIPEIARNIIEKGYQFKWYLIGTGEDEKKIKNLINENNVCNNVILLGEKDNPCQYIKKSDLVIITSRTEAYPNVVNEAKIIGKPVLSTNFGSASEVLTNNVNGYIVEKEKLADIIIDAIKGGAVFLRIKRNAQKYIHSQDDTIKTLLSIL